MSCQSFESRNNVEVFVKDRHTLLTTSIFVVTGRPLFPEIINGRLLLRSPADGFSILSAAFSRAKSCSPLCSTQLSPSFHKQSQDIHAYKMRKQSGRPINNYTLHLLIKFDRLTLVTRERDQKQDGGTECAETNYCRGLFLTSGQCADDVNFESGW